MWTVGSIGGAVRAAKRACGFSGKVEVEARGLGEALEAAEAGADIVMLDNYATPAALIADAARLKAAHPKSSFKSTRPPSPPPSPLASSNPQANSPSKPSTIHALLPPGT